MPVPTDITAGTITLTNGSTAFTGVGTGWLASDIRQGDLIIWLDGGEEFGPPIIASIETNTAGTLENPWPGSTLTDVTYRIRYQWDSSRVSAQSRQLIDQLGNGNIQAFSSLEGPGVPVFNGPHSLIIKPEADFINGVDYDVQVDELADRDAYDAQAAGYSVLVSDMGDGRSAITSKNSNTSGDWSDPAYLTGAVGPMPTLEVGDTTTGLPGTDADVEITPVLGGYELDFTLPEGRGFNPRGLYNPVTAYLVDDLVIDSRGVQWRAKINTTGNAPPVLPTTSNTQWELFAGTRGYNPRGTYSGATAYLADDTVLDNGSTWRAKINTTGNAPPTLPTTSNTQWELVAAKGTDGAGTGDVVGPAGAIDDRIVMFDGTTGKLVADSGYTVATLLAAATVADGDKGDITVSGTGTVFTIDNDAVTNAKLANVATATFKGRVAGGTGDPQDLTGTQATTLLDVVTGDTGSGGVKGLVPAPVAGDTLSDKVLNASGVFVRSRFARLYSYSRFFN